MARPPPAATPTPSHAQTVQPVSIHVFGVSLGESGILESIAGGVILILLTAVATRFRRSIIGAFRRSKQKPAWLVPDYRRTAAFTGREAVLANMRTELEQHGRVALSGPGGIGKTQIALEFAVRRRNAYRGGVFWVDASTETNITSGFVRAARLLDLDPGLQDEQQIVNLFSRWLQEKPSWLLILDNADDVAATTAYLPKLGAGHLVLTSRASTVTDAGIVNPFVIDSMSDDEAVHFLLARTGRTKTENREIAAARQLATELGNYPLALEQAAAYITENRSRFDDYLASFRKRGFKLLAKAKPGQKYPNTIATTWATNFEAIGNASAASADVLRVTAFLDATRIPVTVLTAGAAVLGPTLAEALGDSADPLALNDVLTPLTRYSLIRRDWNSATYSVHRVVQEVVRAGQDGDTQKRWLECAIAAVAAAFPNVEPHNWSACDVLVPHVQVLGSHLRERDLWTVQSAAMFDSAALYVTERARYSEARRFAEQALAIRQQLYGSEHPEVAASLNRLADVFYFGGQYVPAEDLYKRALAMRERLLGPEDAAVAGSLSDLGSVVDLLGRYGEAQQLHERALAIRKRLPDSEQLVAESLNRLANALLGLGNHAEAQRLYEQALEIQERLLGPEHRAVLGTSNNLALVLLLQGDYAEAFRLNEKNFEIRKRLLGPEHPDSLMSANNLANVLYEQERFAEAERVYEKVLETRQRLLGGDHPAVASSLYNLANAFLGRGKNADAQRLYRESLDLRKRTLGPEHPDVADSLDGLSSALAAQGQTAEADVLRAQASAIRNSRGKADDPNPAPSPRTS